MALGEVFQRFVDQSPVSVMVRGLIERLLDPQQLDEWFEGTVEKQYTRELLFSSVFDIMSQVVCGTRPSVHAAYQASEAGIGLIGMKAVRYLAPLWSLGKGDPTTFDNVYGEKFKSSSFSPFQRAYVYVLQHGLDVVNADMQNFKHLEENIIAAATADRYFS